MSDNNNQIPNIPNIPKSSIGRILQTSSFTSKDTRITEETVTKLQKYLELFVREAVLRSLDNKEEKIKNTSNNNEEAQIRVKNEPGMDQSINDAIKNQIELTPDDLEAITGLLLLDM